MTGIVSETELAKANGCIRRDGKIARAKLRRHLERQGVAYAFGAGGQIWTTVDALNAKLGIQGGEATPETYGAEIFR